MDRGFFVRRQEGGMEDVMYFPSWREFEMVCEWGE